MPSTVSGPATRLVELGWANLLKRTQGMPYEKAAEVALEVITSNSANHGNIGFSKGQQLDMWIAIRNFHIRTRSGENDLWLGDHDGVLDYETRNHKINITTTVLLTNFALSLEHLKDDKSLPISPGNGDGTLEMPIDIDISSRTIETKSKYIFLESALRVSHEIMNAWSSLYKEPNILQSTPGLNWIETARHAIAAIYQNINSLDEVFQSQKLELLLEELHKRMVRNKLWDQDSTKSDRADKNGQPLPYSQLSSDMKDNYALILAASLDGIINSKLTLKDK